MNVETKVSGAPKVLGSWELVPESELTDAYKAKMKGWRESYALIHPGKEIDLKIYRHPEGKLIPQVKVINPNWPRENQV